jgi:Zn finger protein HypA/HybF involved in hydrogenase expression
MTSSNASPDEFASAMKKDATVVIYCNSPSCNHESTYANFSEFRRAVQHGTFTATRDAEWPVALATGRFVVECPKCSCNGNSAILTQNPYTTITIETTPRTGESPAFGRNAPFSEKRTKYSDALQQEALPIEVSCSCGFEDSYEYFSNFREIVTGSIAENLGASAVQDSYALASEKLTVCCPSCKSEDAQFTLLDSDSYRLRIQLEDQNNYCPTCTAYIDPDGFKEGPEAPEIGWEYYKCPECSSLFRPEQVTPESE